MPHRQPSEGAARLHDQGKVLPVESYFLNDLEREVEGEDAKVVPMVRRAILDNKPATYVDDLVARVCPRAAPDLPRLAAYAAHYAAA